MRRRVYLGDDLYAQCCSIEDELAELSFRVAAVLGREARKLLALQAEGGIRLVPVLVEIGRKAIVIEVHLQTVHLIVSHRAHQSAQVVQRDILAPAVHHQTAKRVVRAVENLSLWEG